MKVCDGQKDGACPCHAGRYILREAQIINDLWQSNIREFRHES